MEKLHIKIPLILPDVPDEKDHCIQRLIDTLQDEKGIDKIRIADEKNNGIPELCFHYNPDIISIARITDLAKQTGAVLTAKIGHKLFEVTSIQHITPGSWRCEIEMRIAVSHQTIIINTKKHPRGSQKDCLIFWANANNNRK